MKFEKEFHDHFLNGHKKYLRHISVDCVVFGFHENELKVLLLNVNYSNRWALPGGFMLREEHMDEAAQRILRERTGLDKIYLEQFHVFSDPARADKNINETVSKQIGPQGKSSWMFERFISVGYSALVDFTKVKPTPDLFSDSCEWFNVREVPEMAFDHKEILNKALENLQMQLNFHPVGYNLLPLKFTMPDLQKLYETILERKLDRRNFQRKMIGTGILKKLDEIKKGVAHKAPYYYKFDLRKYQKALSAGMGFQLQ